MDIALLKTAAKAGGVNRVAIIDDAYDELTGADIDEARFRTFRSAVIGDAEVQVELARRAALNVERLDDYETFIGDDRLIRALSNLAFQEKPQQAEGVKAIDAIETLFGPSVETAAQKRRQLEPLEKLLAATGLEVFPIRSDWSAEEDRAKLLKCEVVFLDFFLSTVLPADFDIGNPDNAAERDRARQAALNMTSKIVGEFKQGGLPPPSLILVSQNAIDSMAEEFRKESSRMMSRFRFLRKAAVENPDLDTFCKLADIFESFHAASKIEPLVTGWKAAAANALNEVFQDILELDLREYGYLHKYRLLHEGQPLHDYLKWMFSAYLSGRVGQSFSTMPWSDDDAQSLEHFGKSVLVPPRSIARMYSAIRVSTDKGFRRASGREVRSGDLFLWPPVSKGTSKKKLDGQQVRAVLSPACDLVIRTDGANPKAKSVLLVCGNLGLLRASRTTEVHFVTVNDIDYEIEWDLTAPAALPHKELIKLLGRRRDVPFWIGQLRAEYFFALQQDFAHATFRVGLEREPVLASFVGGRVLIRRKDKAKPRLLFEFTEQDAHAWSFIDHDKSRTIHVSFSRDFVMKIYAALDHCSRSAALEKNVITKLKVLLSNAEFFRNLEEPFKLKDAGNQLGVANQLQVKLTDRYDRSDETKGFDLLLFSLFRTPRA